MNDKLLICSEKNNEYRWIATDGTDKRMLNDVNLLLLLFIDNP